MSLSLSIPSWEMWVQAMPAPLPVCECKMMVGPDNRYGPYWLEDFQILDGVIGKVGASKGS